MAVSAAPVVRLYRTSIAKKTIMAVTGGIGILFLILHIWGNLHIFEGSAQFNGYSRFLRIVGAPVFASSQLLWAVRIVLIVCVVLHVTAAVQLWQQSRASRPVGYKVHKNPGATWASRTMRIGGLIILAFIIIHLANLTWGWLHPSFVEGDVYHNVVALFSLWYVTVFYVVAMLAIGFHLYHGAWSMWQTLGVRTRRNDGLLRGGALVLAVVFVLASSAVPVAVLAGLVH
ncbi:MAG TPA: succinate dehydrogenase cytochrome b subunit [Thermomicrobiales bacterium]|nr:succinate dehydrogenase cytochrome b subunit [Thermomicrobiales bacterium]